MKRLPFSGSVANEVQRGRLALVSLAVLFLAMSGAAYGGASGISLLSESHHVWGEAGESQASPPWNATGNVATYDQTSATPLDVSAAYPSVGEFHPGYAHSVAGDFGVLAESVYWYSSAWAASEYRFTPDGSSLLVHVYGGADGFFRETVAQYTLADSTLGVVLDAFEAIGEIQPPVDLGFDWRKSYAVNPGHEYLLTLYAHAGPSDGPRRTTMGADVTCIPCPSALLLGAFGAGLAAWRRRRSLDATG